MMIAVANVAAMPLVAETETVGGYTWTYRIDGDTAVASSSDESFNFNLDPNRVKTDAEADTSAEVFDISAEDARHILISLERKNQIEYKCLKGVKTWQ